MPFNTFLDSFSPEKYDIYKIRIKRRGFFVFLIFVSLFSNQRRSRRMNVERDLWDVKRNNVLTARSKSKDKRRKETNRANCTSYG